MQAKRNFDIKFVFTSTSRLEKVQKDQKLQLVVELVRGVSLEALKFFLISNIFVA